MNLRKHYTGYRSHILLILFFVITLSCQLVENRKHVTIIVPESVTSDQGYSLALSDLKSALTESGIKTVTHSSSGNTMPAGDEIVVCKAVDSMSESYVINQVAKGDSKKIEITGGERGLMYGIFKLAEEIRIGKDLWSVSLEMSPDFSRRIFSEEGQLFDLPSVGYHLLKAPWVNNERFEKEKTELKTLIDEVARLGFNTLGILHVNFEDYISYKYLDKETYSKEDVHRIKSKLFATHLNEIIDYAHARHIEVFLQVYEFQYPPRLEEQYEIDLGNPGMKNIIDAKLRELFEEVRLDGLIVTATETLPRSGYKSKELWKKYGKEGAGKMMTMYYNAAKAVGRTVIFRSWMVSFGAEDSYKIFENTPVDAQFEIKHTGHDFWLNYPLTSLVSKGIGYKRPLTITFDVFPQYYGWSRLICYQHRISEEAKIAKENGVSGIQAWGAWAPGCIWSDDHPGYTPEGQLKNPEKVFYDMAGPWNNFRIFTRGFTPGQMNAYQLSRIAWDTKLEAKEIAHDWGAIHFGIENADNIAEVLMDSQEAFRELYPPGTWNFPFLPVYLTWATTTMLDTVWIREVYKDVALSEIVKSNQAAYARLKAMEEALSRIDPEKVPDKEIYAKFTEGFEKTELYISMYLEFRELWIRTRDFWKVHRIEQSKDWLDLDFCRERLDNIIEKWQKYPEECKYWGINKEIFNGRKDYTFSPREVLEKFNQPN